MATRYVVHGRSLGGADAEAPAGVVVRKVIEAESAKAAEAIAARLGMEVLGSEVLPSEVAEASAAEDGGGGGFSAGEAGAKGNERADERAQWSGSPSQWSNFWWFVSCVLVLPVPFALAAWLRTRCTRYVLTSQRLRLERGVISRTVEEVELYRVTDSAVAQTVVGRLLGLGDVTLETSDKRNPTVVMAWVPEPMALREKIRGLAEDRRRWRRVGEIEVS